ncbi:MAG: N-acetyltransferase [Bacteroidales bacterium]|nr:N-acetyltransferase [Bacteroidales bacterium]
MAEYYAHNTSVIDPPCTIGEGTRIWHFCHVMRGANIGSNCNIGQNVMVGTDVKIGSCVKIQNNVSVYTGVEIEDDVFVGPSAVFTNVINPRSFVERKNEFKKTYVRRGATIGANSTIVCGVEIGQYALIGAGSTVTKNVKPFALVMGVPATQKGWVSRNGQKLSFNAEGIATCSATGERYRLSDGAVELLLKE